MTFGSVTERVQLDVGDGEHSARRDAIHVLPEPELPITEIRSLSEQIELRAGDDLVVGAQGI